VVIGGRWWATWKRGEQTSALVIDMRDRKIAENPLLAREKSFWAGRPLGKDGSAFDGVNVVSLSQTSGVIKASWLKTLSGSATPVLRPKAAFGDLQGFATDWAVLADIPGTTNVYYLTAAAATGVLQSDNKKLLDFAVLPTTESGLGCLNLLKTTGHTYLISRCGPVTDPISRLDVSGTTVTKQAVSSSLFATQVLSYLYLIGTANADALYLAHYTTIGKIPDSGSEETISPGAVAGETDTNCATRYVYGIGKDNATTKPLVLLRPCASTGNASATQIYVVRYSDWTFTTVDAELSLGTAPSYELQFYAVASDHWAVAGKEGDKYFVFQSTNAALNLLNANGVIKTIARDGVAVFGDGLRGGEFDLMLPWDGTSFVVSGLTADQQFKSYRVDAAAATEAVMADLNGVQLYSGFVTKDYVFAVSGLDVASNTQIVARFDPDGTLVGKTSTSGVKVSQLVALPSPKP
jgi:hypothetical protein